MSLRCDKKPHRSSLIIRIACVLVASILVFPFQVSAPSTVFATSEGTAPLTTESAETTSSAVTTPVAQAPTVEAPPPSKITPQNLPIALMSALPFEVTGDLNDSYNTLAEAVTAINSDAGTNYTITASQNETITNLDIDKHVLLTSASGITATLTNTVGARHFQISAGGSLTLEDITLQGTTQTTGNTPAGGINVLAQGSLTLESGATIKGVSPAAAATSYVQGAAVQCAGTLTMNGGLITDNHFAYTGGQGAGVFVTGANASFTFKGGTISGNTASVAAGVAIEGDATFVLDGGTISGNTASSTNNASGGGVYLVGAGSTFDMYSGSIDGNHANSSGSYNGDGGGVYVGSSAVFTLHGGTISNNTATTEGGGVYANGATMTIIAGLITGNSAGSGGGVSIGPSTASKFIMNGGDFVGNHATASGSFGGGLYLQEGGTVTLQNGSFRNNTSAFEGGAVDFAGTLNVTITNMVFDGNSAAGGGGFFVPVTIPVAIDHTVFSNNKAISQGGGAIWSTSGTAQNLTISSTVTFQGNSAPTAYPPPANVATLCPNIKTTSSSIYGHPLNNYDINYAQGTAGVVVTVYYIDQSNQPVGNPSSAFYAMTSGSSFSLNSSQIPAIQGYRFDDWKNGSAGALHGNTTVSLPSVTASTSLYLIFEKVPQINVSVPVKLMFSAFQSESGAITAPDYYLQNNGTTAVDVTLQSLTVDVTGDLVLTTDPTAEGELGLKLQGTGSSPLLGTTDWLTPGTTDLLLGTLAIGGQTGDRGDFTLTGHYAGDFTAKKTPRYLATFEFSASSL